MNSATGLINLGRNIGGGVGMSLVTTLQARLAQRHQCNLVGHLSPLNPRYREALHGITAVLKARRSCAAGAAHQAQALLYNERLRQSAMLAFIDVFWTVGVLSLAMIPLMFLIKSAPRTQEPVSGQWALLALKGNDYNLRDRLAETQAA